MSAKKSAKRALAARQKSAKSASARRKKAPPPSLYAPPKPLPLRPTPLSEQRAPWLVLALCAAALFALDAVYLQGRLGLCVCGFSAQIRVDLLAQSAAGLLGALAPKARAFAYAVGFCAHAGAIEHLRGGGVAHAFFALDWAKIYPPFFAPTPVVAERPWQLDAIANVYAASIYAAAALCALIYFGYCRRHPRGAVFAAGVGAALYFGADFFLRFG